MLNANVLSYYSEQKYFTMILRNEQCIGLMRARSTEPHAPPSTAGLDNAARKLLLVLLEEKRPKITLTAPREWQRKVIANEMQ